MDEDAGPVISVVVADDQELVRAGIVMLLSAVPDLRVVAEAGDGRAAVSAARETRADVVLMDLRMPGTDGVEATAELVGAGDPSRVLVLTTFGEEPWVLRAVRAGASGFLLKQSAPQLLPVAVRAVAAGHGWLDPAVTAPVLRELSSAPGTGPPGGLAEVLTPRELDVLTLMARGLSNGEVSAELFLSEATVKSHVAHVVGKTGSRDRAQAVSLAWRSGLLRRPADRC